MKFILLVVFFSALVSLCSADIYLHSMRGSNNRLDEANRERANANRLFDSQNNNRGGYNVGSLFYYVGEEVQLEWTNQHACNNAKTNCDLILQFMCDDALRDGTTTKRIPEEEWADLNPEYGRHESYGYYQKCKTRERNQGLFTADQQLKGETAKYTRQNPNGQRYGFECPEERDYYPYWHPSPWMDIAVFTDNMTRCEEFFQKESQNVVGKGACFNVTTHKGQVHEQEVVEENSPVVCTLKGMEWRLIDQHDLPAPKCVEAPWSRDNHLGNTKDTGETSAYVWKVPDFVHERCALRMRYNISTGDYDGWDSGTVNNKLNDREGLKLGLTEFYKSAPDVYPFQNNPVVGFGLDGVELELAINTAQYGRTFEDRSHRFSIRPRPDFVGGRTIKALNVRGKRGNIVQTFPAVEYDFQPNNLEVKTSDYVHFQWTGSNTNPANNDGQGKRQTDRSNIVQILDKGHTYPAHLKHSSIWNDSKANWQNGVVPFTVFTALNSVSDRGSGQFGGEMSELDDSGCYQDHNLVKMKDEGVFHYMCSRNNNFSNRQQKATIVVDNSDDDDDASKLSSGSVTGIVLGVAAVTGLLVAAAVVSAIYLRKQRQLAAATAGSSYAPVATEEQDFSNIYTDQS